MQVDGYDEAVRGWGEDIDINGRLELIGVVELELPSDSFEAISHDDIMRGLPLVLGRDPKVKNRWVYRTYLL